jgi:hypothetical protein
MVWRGRLKSKAVKYDVEVSVQETKDGSWTYKGHQGLTYIFWSSSNSPTEKDMTVIRIGGTSM